MQTGWKTVKDENDDPCNLSAYGMTRCGAAHNHICLQRHSDGALFFSDGDFLEKFYIGLNPLNKMDDPVFYSETVPQKLAVCTAVAVIGNG